MIIVREFPRRWSKEFLPAVGRYCRGLTGKPWFQKWENGHYSGRRVNRYLISGFENQGEEAPRLFERKRDGTGSPEFLARFHWCFYDEDRRELLPVEFPAEAAHSALSP